MAVENFSTYAEVDEDGDITVTATKCDVDSMRRDALSYVRSDKDANHFGEFEHLVTVHYGSGDNQANVAFWAISDGSNTEQQMDNSNEGLRGCLFVDDPPNARILVRDFTNDNQDLYTVTPGNTYYLTIERAGTTLTCKIYSDPTRETLLDTLTLTCGEDLYRYVYGIQSRESTGTPAAGVTMYSENLDLQEEAPPAGVGRSFGFIIG